MRPPPGDRQEKAMAHGTSQPSMSTRRAMALPMVLVALSLAGISVGSLYFMTQTGAKRTSMMRHNSEHLYLAEGVLANYLNRLKKTTWELRYYAQGKDPLVCQSDSVVGSYGGADYLLVVSDVADAAAAGKPTRNLVDLFMKVTYNDRAQNIVSRVHYRAPTPLEPTAYDVVRLSVTPAEVDSSAKRATLASSLTADSQAQLVNTASARVYAREARALAASGKGATVIANTLLAQDMTARTVVEASVQDALKRGWSAFRNDGQQGRYAEARDAFDQGRALAEASRGAYPTDAAKTVPEALYGLGLAYAGLAEALASTGYDDLDLPQQAQRAALLGLAQASLGRVINEFPASVHRPYSIISQSKVLAMIDPSPTGLAAAQAMLARLLPEYESWYLWGQDRPVASDQKRNSSYNFLQVALTNASVGVQQAPDGTWNVWAANIFSTTDREAIALTQLPDLDAESAQATIEKDLVSSSADGAKVAFRVVSRAAGVTKQQVFTMDRDGQNLREISASTAGDAQVGWQPQWFSAWKANPADFPQGTPETTPDSVDDMVNKPMSQLNGSEAISTITKLARFVDNPTGSPAGLVQRLGSVGPVPAALTSISQTLGILRNSWGSLSGPPTSVPASALAIYALQTIGFEQSVKKLGEQMVNGAKTVNGLPPGYDKRLEEGIKKTFEGLVQLAKDPDEDKTPKKFEEARRIFQGKGGPRKNDEEDERQSPGNGQSPDSDDD